MKITRKLVFLPLLVFLFPVVSMGETVDRKELVVRDNLYYKKFSDLPFTGTVTGKQQGEAVEGKRVGVWLNFYSTGQLSSRLHFSSDGIRNGEYVSYTQNGCLWSKGNIVDGKKDGWWFEYREDCGLEKKGQYDNGSRVGQWTIYHQNGKKRIEGTWGIDDSNDNVREGLWVYYFKNGQVHMKGSYKGSSLDGPWFHYNESGDLVRKNIWKNGTVVEDEEY